MLRFIFLLTLLVSIVLPAYAQDDAVPMERYIAPDESFSFFYPADWELSTEVVAPLTFSVPIASTGAAQDGISIDTDVMTIMLYLEAKSPNQVVEDIAQERAAEFADIGTVSEPALYTLNEKPLAQIDVTAIFNFTYLVLELAPDSATTLVLSGTADQIAHALPMAFELLGTMRLGSDLSPQKLLEISAVLSETYTSTLHGVTFQYPADWTVEEVETYTLITAPNGVSMGLSQTSYEIPEDAKDGIAAFEVEETAARVLDQVPTVVVGEMQLFELHKRKVARIDIIEPSTPTQFTAAAIEFGENTIGRITVIGDPVMVTHMDVVILSILDSLYLAE